MKKRIYYFSRPNCMLVDSEHLYTDDVAITFAKNKKQAIEHFKILYSWPDLEQWVFKLPKIGKGFYHDPFVLTSY